MLRSMAVFSRRVDATVVALTWKRSVVVEQAHWVPRRTAWKPHRDNVRNLRTVQVKEGEITSDRSLIPGLRAGSMPATSREVLGEHTYYEYEELQWRRLRSFSAKGDGPEDLRWPVYTLEPEQRISEKRETYHATFSVARSAGDAGSGAAEYTAELDEATWRALEAGRQCRLTVGTFSDEVKQVTPLPGSRR
jgi:hypothetical protein